MSFGYANAVEGGSGNWECEGQEHGILQLSAMDVGRLQRADGDILFGGRSIAAIPPLLPRCLEEGPPSIGFSLLTALDCIALVVVVLLAAPSGMIN